MVRSCPTGGKWTTYRRMAQDAIDRALKTGKLGVQTRPCATTYLKLVRSHPDCSSYWRTGLIGSSHLYAS